VDHAAGLQFDPRDGGGRGRATRQTAAANQLHRNLPILASVVDDVLDDGPVGGPATPGTLPRLLSAARIEQVLVTTERDIDCVDVESRWAGGFVSRHGLSRPVQTYEQVPDYWELMASIAALRGTPTTVSETAATSNAEGFGPPKRSLRFAKEILSGLPSHTGCS
jgi:hypothetical protein